MSADEPADGGYVAIAPYGHVDTVRVYRRHDRQAGVNLLGEARWFSRTDPHERARTWSELTEMGALAYVGEFVQR